MPFLRATLRRIYRSFLRPHLQDLYAIATSFTVICCRMMSLCPSSTHLSMYARRHAVLSGILPSRMFYSSVENSARADTAAILARFVVLR